MWEGWKIEPRGKVDPAVRHTRMACTQSPIFRIAVEFVRVSEGSSLVNGSCYVRIVVN